jgi:hypothetical protein
MIIRNGRKEIHASEPEAVVDEEPVISRKNKALAERGGFDYRRLAQVLMNTTLR